LNTGRTNVRQNFWRREGYEAVYRTNAVTRHGEHGNAMLSRWPVVAHQHEDMSDHRFEQRGLLHSELQVHGAVHVVVVHLGLIGPVGASVGTAQTVCRTRSAQGCTTAGCG
jgi:endonuclease/exonuclease/phosphatase family metal-dependent hydrolase